MNELDNEDLTILDIEGKTPKQCPVCRTYAVKVHQIEFPSAGLAMRMLYEVEQWVVMPMEGGRPSWEPNQEDDFRIVFECEAGHQWVETISSSLMPPQSDLLITTVHTAPRAEKPVTS